MENTENKQEMQHSKHAMYGRFAVMAVVMFIAMYLIMFAMIDRLQNLIPNINNLYMTLLMVSVIYRLFIYFITRNIIQGRRDDHCGNQIKNSQNKKKPAFRQTPIENKINDDIYSFLISGAFNGLWSQPPPSALYTATLALSWLTFFSTNSNFDSRASRCVSKTSI